MSTAELRPEAGPPMFLPAPFDGYPYLVTRIGHSALRGVTILPADWPRKRLVDLARPQAQANQLDTAVCLDPDDVVYFDADGRRHDAGFVPVGLPVPERIQPADPILPTPDVVARRAALDAYAKSCNRGGYVVGDGLEGGRPASSNDVERLGRRDAEGQPAGLTRCASCSWHAGDYLRPNTSLPGEPLEVVRVHCRCDNHNRCARCGEPLAESRLSAWSYYPAEDRVLYRAAYGAFSHSCPESRTRRGAGGSTTGGTRQ